MSEWPSFALYWYAPSATGAPVDPIFGKAINFYLFSLPAWQFIVGWLLTLAMIACPSRRFLHFRYRQHSNALGTPKQLHLAAMARVLHCVWAVCC